MTVTHDLFISFFLPGLILTERKSFRGTINLKKRGELRTQTNKYLISNKVYKVTVTCLLLNELNLFQRSVLRANFTGECYKRMRQVNV